MTVAKESMEQEHSLAIADCHDATPAPCDADKTASLSAGSDASSAPVTDNGPPKGGRRKNNSPERLCIATRETGDRAGMIRFVVGPDESLVPDLKATLPGRGAWVTNSREAVLLAVQKNLFSRAFRKKVAVSTQLVEQIAQLRMDTITGYLAMANKAGLAITGFDKAIETIKNGKAIMVIHSREAANDGRKKLAAAIRRYQTDFPGASPLFIFDGIDGQQLDQTLGKANINHIAFKAGPVVLSLVDEVGKYLEYQTGERRPQPDIPGADRPGEKEAADDLADQALKDDW